MLENNNKYFFFFNCKKVMLPKEIYCPFLVSELGIYV